MGSKMNGQMTSNVIVIARRNDDNFGLSAKETLLKIIYKKNYSFFEFI